MSSDPDIVAGAVARHHIANLLHTYVEIADGKDVDSAVDLLGDARVQFPSGGYDASEAARSFFADLWAAPTPHRHDVTNLRVDRGHGGFWHARAHYTRWIISGDPVLHTLGTYTLVVDSAEWAITELVVDRVWTKG
ncbi:nuclear transport factor 2 family protein [Rhodococcus sp. MEB041]|uniref:nuclear transport factor 2 family protein n=1 Tax=Rhodococcus sp. MEB041 TaxID=3040323 RepID=UPI00254A0022|nr:nuclear transport factor 2 family protein [Rhodococcus sp. MEB041]